MESVKGFSDDTMYLNVLWRIRVILNFRIMADKYGNVVHLGERDCSIQRRHQKSAGGVPVHCNLRGASQKMGETAVKGSEGRWL